MIRSNGPFHSQVPLLKWWRGHPIYFGNGERERFMGESPSARFLCPLPPAWKKSRRDFEGPGVRGGGGTDEEEWTESVSTTVRLPQKK